MSTLTRQQPAQVVPRELEGRVALITGGAGAFGSAISKDLASAGANIAVHDLRADAAEQTADEIRSFGVDSIACVGDISNPEDVERAFAVVLGPALNKGGVGFTV